MSNKIKTIALSALKPSKSNIRKTERLAGLEGLAASIEANGLLENLVVKPCVSNKRDDPMYEVVAGGRRLAALKLLAKRKKITRDHGIPCLVLVNGAGATEVSLAENFVRIPAHPADQFEAFAALIHEGKSADDVAARFGVNVTFVEQRLKLASVAPRLVAEYRSGAMTLEQLTAFTLSGDHRLQEEVWFERVYDDLPAHMIRAALTRTQVASSDPRARLIGSKAYEAAGGIIVRDLFDAEDEGYFQDSQLLDRLVQQKLDEAAQGLRGEGWQWVDVHPSAALVNLGHYRRTSAAEAPLSADDEACFQALSSRYDALVAELEEEGGPEEELAKITAEIEELERKRDVWTDEQKSASGAILCLQPDGTIDIVRGLVRYDGNGKANGTDVEGGKHQRRTGYPDSLLLDLSAHRTIALREVVAGKPDVALTALLHVLVGQLFFHGAEGSCLSLSASEVSLERASASVGSGKAAEAFASRRQSWTGRFPEQDGLWEWIASLDESDRSLLLAHCVATLVSALEGEDARAEGARKLSDAVKLDMREWWHPTSGDFLSRLTREQILATVSEGVSQEASWRLASLKKDRMARQAEKLLQASSWLPVSLRRNPEGLSPSVVQGVP